MNDTKILNYIVRPTKPYPIYRNCPGCLGKSTYQSTGKFRVNANGNRLDVWLIYQCESCKHTYNLPIYERVRPDRVPTKEYEEFLANSSSLALQYGTTLRIFSSAHALIAWPSVPYELTRQGVYTENENLSCSISDTLTIDNPYSLKVRMDKLVAEILSISRSKVTQAIKQKEIEIITSGTKSTILLTGSRFVEDSTLPLKEVS